MRSLTLALAFTALSAGAVSAQTGATSTPAGNAQQERVGAILGALFGGQTGTAGGGLGSLDTQWTFGQFPLAQQRTQFETQIDGNVRSGTIGAAAGDRAKSDYRALVDLENRYGADRRFTTEERTDLKTRYDNLTKVVSEGGYASGVSGGRSVADGRIDFEKRIDEGVRNRRIGYAQASALKTEYSDIVRLEASYMQDGGLSVRERDDLDNRLDALDKKVPESVAQTPAPAPLPARPTDPTARLDLVTQAATKANLTEAAKTQLLVEKEDLRRLAASYKRVTPSAEEQGYLDRRIAELETRVRLR